MTGILESIVNIKLSCPEGGFQSTNGDYELRNYNRYITRECSFKVISLPDARPKSGLLASLSQYNALT